MANYVARLLKHAAYRSPLARFFAARYGYNFRPAQLCFLVHCLDRTRHLAGPILEVGCFQGATTIWLKTHLRATGVEKEYFAIDTFEGFVVSDVDHELTERGKLGDARLLRKAFASNDASWVRKALALNGFPEVHVVKADASTYDYSVHRDISFALIDVDLYVPVRNALAAMWEQMADGGIIVVDDCAPGNVYDGALQAYREFTAMHGLPEQIVEEKLGVIEVRRS
jgi:predicted O-methyltransferase YrrM